MTSAASYGLGVVIGKFYPPHLGHHHLIDTALAQCRQLRVIVCAKPTDRIDGVQRSAWLQAQHPRAEVQLIDDRYDENDSRIWATNTLQWLGRAPDAVFSSEDYGPAYAALMGAAHVMVDRMRDTVPCSGTLIRSDLYRHWDFLAAPTRAGLVRRIAVVGAESTGTTTLSKALAAHYQSVWVPEYGREYSLQKQQRAETEWHTGEFADIARRQCAMEDEAALQARRVLICDTNAFATTLWHRRYLGCDSDEVALIAAGRRYDLVLLTGDEIAFEQDGLRDGEHLRHDMHRQFEAALRAQPHPWMLLRGSAEARLAAAVARIDALLLPSAPWPGEMQP